MTVYKADRIVVQASNKAINNAVDAAGAHLEKLKKYNLSLFTPAEFREFIQVIADEVASEDAVPF